MGDVQVRQCDTTRSIVLQVAGGGVGDAVLMLIIGIVRQMMSKP